MTHLFNNNTDCFWNLKFKKNQFLRIDKRPGEKYNSKLIKKDVCKITIKSLRKKINFMSS